MSRFELYGWRDVTLRKASELLSAAIGARFELHSSDYLGGDYFRGTGPDGARITVQPNVADDEGYLIEQDFPEHRTLVYLSDDEDGPGWSLDLDGLELLRSELR
ncbi:MAG: hypothetical protein ACT4PX_06550 [Actinomycetota bacterium]